MTRVLIIIAGSAVALLIFLAFLANTTDLRGTPPASSLSQGTPLSPTTLEGSNFTLADCWAPSIQMHALPNSREVRGTATETVIACRSRQSLFVWTGIHMLLTAGALGLAYGGRIRRRKPRQPR